MANYVDLNGEEDKSLNPNVVYSPYKFWVWRLGEEIFYEQSQANIAWAAIARARKSAHGSP